MPANADEIELGVVVALPAEADGWDSRGNTQVIVAGIGIERARLAAERLLQRGARALLSFGVCGGLSPPWRSGDLLLPRHVVAKGGEWRTDDHWHTRLLAALPSAHEIDALHSDDTPILSLDEKQALAMRGFAAADMESAGVAQAAARERVPFVAIKAVCDPVTRAVPEWALHMLNGEGKLRPHAMLEAVLRGPRAWSELRALRADFAQARASLRGAARMVPHAVQGIAQ